MWEDNERECKTKRKRSLKIWGQIYQRDNLAKELQFYSMQVPWQHNIVHRFVTEILIVWSRGPTNKRDFVSC